MFCTLREHDLYKNLPAYAATLTALPELHGKNGLYMRRFVVQRLEEGSCLRLHHILRPDEDPEFHDHPWGNRHDPADHPSRSLLLVGGYEEQRLIRKRFVLHRSYRAGDINTIYGHDLHRIHRLFDERGVWTLFWTGWKYKSWGFVNKDTGDRTPWRDFVRSKGLELAE